MHAFKGVPQFSHGHFELSLIFSALTLSWQEKHMATTYLVIRKLCTQSIRNHMVAQIR